jgi:hypothetical protein
LKDSKQVIQLLAESLVYDTLHDKDTPKKFGEVLQYVFSYESTLANTRSQLYWAINTPDCFKSIESLTAWQLKSYFNTHAISQLSFAARTWVVTPQARKTVICPLLTWTLRQKEFVITPLAYIIQDSLPFVQVQTVSSLVLLGDHTDRIDFPCPFFRLLKIGTVIEFAKECHHREPPVRADQVRMCRSRVYAHFVSD